MKGIYDRRSKKKAGFEEYIWMIKFMQITFIFTYALKVRKAVNQPIIVAIFGKGFTSRCPMFTILFSYYMNF